MGDIYTNPPQSRNEAILRATIDGTEYTAPPQSRIEDLLLELKEAIEQGGTGEGDMKKSVYDSDSSIASAGGIKMFVNQKIGTLPQRVGSLETTAGVLEGEVASIEDTLDNLGTASIKNAISVVTDSSDLVESGAVYTALQDKADNSVIGTVEDDTNPTKDYAVSEHMIRGGKFCTVTVPVNTSSTWTLGSNYVEGTIADLIAPLNGTLTSSNGTIEANRIYTCGNLVTYMIRFKATENISAGADIIHGIKLPALVNDGMTTALFTDISTGNTYRVNLHISANIPHLKTLDAIANNTTIRGTITYISQ